MEWRHTNLLQDTELYFNKYRSCNEDIPIYYKIRKYILIGRLKRLNFIVISTQQRSYILYHFYDIKVDPHCEWLIQLNRQEQ